MTVNNEFLRLIYKLIARFYLKNRYMTDWLFEKYQRPASLFRLFVNLLYFYARIKSSPYILTATVDIITKCNLKCPMCRGIYSVLESNEPMSKDFYEKILRRLPRSIESILLTQSGEPFLHPQIFELIDLTSRYGFRPILFTNGTLLNEKLARQILASSLDTLNISTEIDEDNSMKQRGIDLRSLERKIVMLLKLKRQMKSPVKVKLSIVVHSRNKDSLASFLRKWGQLVDGIKVNPKFTNDLKQQPVICNELWRGHISIRINGAVTPCCLDLMGTFNIGNISTADALSIWQGKRFRDLRASILRLRFPSLCYHCSWDESAGLKRIRG